MRRRVLLAALLLGTTAVLAGCGGPAITLADLPVGDAERGAQLFLESVNEAPSCSGCHSVDGTAVTGPSLLGFGAAAGERVAGQSDQEYALSSIVQPATHLVPGFGNQMYGRYADQLTAQQIADLIAYLLTL